MVSTYLKMFLELLLVICYLSTTASAIRADLQEGFKMCPGEQLGRLISVEVDSTDCFKSNGEIQWPCLAITGNTGVFTISFTHDNDDEFDNVYSTVDGHVKARLLGFSSVLEVEDEKDAASHVYYQSIDGPKYGCPIEPEVVYKWQKKLTVPGGLLFVQNELNVEFKLTDEDEEGDTIWCFTSPMVKG